MKIHVLFVCFLSVAFDRNAVINAQSNLYTKMEGEDFRIESQFTVPAGSIKYLCRNDCQKKEDLLIETHRNRTKSGRYTIRYDSVANTVHAVITELTKSDAGRYKVGVRTSSSSLGSFKEFEIKVRDLCDGGIVYGQHRVYSATKGGEITIQCSLSLHPQNRKFLCRGECNKFIIDTNDMTAMSSKYKINYLSNTLFNVTILELTESDSGRYRCGVGRQDKENTCQEFEITFAGTDGDILLPVVGFVTVIVVALTVSALLVYKWKRSAGVEYVNTRGQRSSNEITIYDDCAEVSTYDTSHYQDLHQCSREQNLYYSINISQNRT